MSINLKNKRNILLAVYYILQKRYPRTGLRFFAEKSLIKKDEYYFTFYIPNYGDIYNTIFHNELSLTIYQNIIGLPSFSNGGFELAHPYQGKTEMDPQKQIAPYYTNRLELDELFLRSNKEITAFQNSQFSQSADSYLFSVKFLCRYYCNCGEDRNISMADIEDLTSLENLNIPDAYQINGAVFLSDGRVLTRSGELIDVAAILEKGIGEKELIEKIESI